MFSSRSCRICQILKLCAVLANMQSFELVLDKCMRLLRFRSDQSTKPIIWVENQNGEEASMKNRGVGARRRTGIGFDSVIPYRPAVGHIVFFFTFLDFGTNLYFLPRQQNRPFAGYITFLGGFLVIFLLFFYIYFDCIFKKLY